MLSLRNFLIIFFIFAFAPDACCSYSASFYSFPSSRPQSFQPPFSSLLTVLSPRLHLPPPLDRLQPSLMGLCNCVLLLAMYIMRWRLLGGAYSLPSSSKQTLKFKNEICWFYIFQFTVYLTFRLRLNGMKLKEFRTFLLYFYIKLNYNSTAVTAWMYISDCQNFVVQHLIDTARVPGSWCVCYLPRMQPGETRRAFISIN